MDRIIIFTFDKDYHTFYDEASLGTGSMIIYQSLFLMYIIMMWYTNYLHTEGIHFDDDDKNNI